MRRAFAEQRERRSDISTDAQKYKPGLDPLEKEAALTVIQDRGELENKKIRKILQKMIDGAKTEAERNALLMWKSHLRADQISGLIQKEFVRDFWAWLLGRGKEADHAKTPWYRQSLTHDAEVSAYCDSFVIKMQEFRLKLAKLGLRVPKGINQAFLFFKYVVRGEDPNKASFLHDWQLFNDEFNEARAAGQRERNLDPIGKVYDGQHNHHEMAPYGGDAKKATSEVRETRLEAEIANDAGDEDEAAPMDIDIDIPFDVMEAQAAAQKLHRAAEKNLSPEQQAADAKATAELFAEEISKTEKKEKKTEADEQKLGQMKEAKEKNEKAAKDFEKKKEDKERKREEKIKEAVAAPTAANVGKASNAVEKRVGQLKNNVAEGLQKPKVVAKEARKLADELKGVPFQFDPVDYSSIESKQTFEDTKFQAQTMADVLGAKAPNVPVVAKRIAKESEARVDQAFNFVPPPPESSNFVASTPIVDLSPPKAVKFIAIQTKISEQLAQLTNSIFGEAPPVIEPVLPPKEKEEMDAEPKAPEMIKTTVSPPKFVKTTVAAPEFVQTTKAAETPTEPAKTRTAVDADLEEPQAAKIKVAKVAKNLMEEITEGKKKVAKSKTRTARAAEAAAREAARLSAYSRQQRDLDILEEMIQTRIEAIAPRMVQTTISAPKMVKTTVAPPKMVWTTKMQEAKVEVAKKKRENGKRLERAEELVDSTLKEAGKASKDLKHDQEKAESKLESKKRQVVQSSHADYQALGDLIARTREISPPQFVRTTAPIPPQFVRTTVPAAESAPAETAEPVPPQFVKTTVTPPQFVKTTVTPPQFVKTTVTPPQFVRTTAPAPAAEQAAQEPVAVPEVPQEPKQSLPPEVGGETGMDLLEEELKELRREQAKAFNANLYQMRQFAKRYAPELEKHLQPWDGSDEKQKKYLIKISQKIQRKIASTGDMASRPDNLKLAKKLDKKVKKSTEAQVRRKAAKDKTVAKKVRWNLPEQ